MNCFYHPQAPAVGMCKHCYRGICTECATDSADALSCLDRCEVQVAELQSLTQRAKVGYAAAGSGWKRQGFAVLVFACIFLVIGMFERRVAFFMVPAGIGMLLMAALQFQSGMRIQRALDSAVEDQN